MYRSLTRLFCCLLLSLLLAVPARSEVDDSSLFMEAFNAFQRKDYLLSADKLTELNQHFPDSPLRDVALLMLARSNQRAGDNETAARIINQFSTEFSASTLAASVEEELLSLGKRQKTGEKLTANRQLQLAAAKVRNERLAQERAAAERAERERLARERAEAERLAREKAEAERRELERLAAIKAARDAIRFSIELPEGELLAEAGASTAIPFELVNRGTGAEEFVLEGSYPTGLHASLVALEETGAATKQLHKVLLQPREALKAQLNVILPGDRVDGSRHSITIKASSASFTDLQQTRTFTLTTQASLLRAVAKLQRPEVLAGEQLSYRVTVLNVGSRPAREVDLRITLPSQLRLADAGDGCWIEGEQLAACRISAIAPGQLTERTLKVAVREKASGQQLRGTVEVLQTVLQTKESFQGASFSIRQP